MDLYLIELSSNENHFTELDFWWPHRRQLRNHSLATMLPASMQQVHTTSEIQEVEKHPPELQPSSTLEV